MILFYYNKEIHEINPFEHHANHNANIYELT